MADLRAFLAGDLPDHVALFLADSFVDDADALAEHGERVGDGVALVVEGDRGRSVFGTATGLDATSFAREAGATDGTVDPDLAGGECPAAEDAGEEAAGTNPEDDTDHRPRFVFSFVEPKNEAVGGIYAEGDVVHAYASCDCGRAYSAKWVVGER